MVNKIHNKQVVIPYLTNPLFMPVSKSEDDKLSIDSFPFDIPDVGAGGQNVVEEEEEEGEEDLSKSRTNSTKEEVSERVDPDLKSDSASPLVVQPNITKG